MQRQTIVIVLFLTFVCLVNASPSGYISPQIGQTKVVEGVMNSPILYGNSHREETHHYTAPDGWYICSYNVDHVDLKSAGSHEVKPLRKANDHHKIFSKFLEKHTIKTPEKLERLKELKRLRKKVSKEDKDLLGKIEQSHKELHLKLIVKGDEKNLALVHKKVIVELVYLGTFREFVQYLEYRSKSPTSFKPRKISPVTKIHFQTLIDTIEEISTILSQKMEQDEEVAFDFASDLQHFAKTNKIASIKFVTTSSPFTCVLHYDFQTFNGDNQPIRKTVYKLSDFLKTAEMSIHIEVDGYINNTPSTWEEMSPTTAKFELKK